MCFMSRVDRRWVLRVLYVTIFLTSTGLGTSTFLLPVYAEELGATYFDLGLIGAVGSIVYTLVTLASGYLLDRFERVRLYLLFTLVGAVVVLMLAGTSRVVEVLVMRGLLGAVSATFWVTASTLTAIISPPGALTQSMGRYNLAWITGFTVGPFLGGLISGAYGFQALFTTLSAMVLLSVLIIWQRVWRRIELQNAPSERRLDLSALRELVWAYLTLVPFTMVLGIYMAIMPGHMRVVGLAPALIGLLITTTNGVRGVCFLSVEKFVRWGARRSLYLASFLLTVSMLAVSSARSTMGFALPLVLYGVAAGIVTPVVLDYIAKRTPREALGAAMGAHEGIYGVGMFVGSLAGGAVAEAYQPSTLYLILAGVSLLILPLSWKMTVDAVKD